MIKDYFNGKKVTPKQFAARVLSLSDLGEYWNEKYEDEYQAMTEKEREQVDQQLNALRIRIREMLQPTLNKIGE